MATSKLVLKGWSCWMRIRSWSCSTPQTWHRVKIFGPKKQDLSFSVFVTSLCFCLCFLCFFLCFFLFLCFSDCSLFIASIFVWILSFMLLGLLVFYGPVLVSILLSVSVFVWLLCFCICVCWVCANYLSLFFYVFWLLCFCSSSCLCLCSVFLQEF